MIAINTERKIGFSKGIIIFILLSYLPVPYLLQSDIIYNFFNLWRIIAATLIIINVLLNKLKITKFIFLIFAFYFVLLLSTIRNNGDLFGIIEETIFV